MDASQLGTLALIGLGALLLSAVRAQLNPFALCEACKGRAPSDKSGKYTRQCRRCGGSPKRLRAGAWIQLKMGIPVPRAKPSKKRHRMSLEHTLTTVDYVTDTGAWRDNRWESEEAQEEYETRADPARPHQANHSKPSERYRRNGHAR